MKSFGVGIHEIMFALLVDEHFLSVSSTFGDGIHVKIFELFGGNSAFFCSLFLVLIRRDICVALMFVPVRVENK